MSNLAFGTSEGETDHDFVKYTTSSVGHFVEFVDATDSSIRENESSTAVQQDCKQSDTSYE